jgi:Ca-activated chloride channel family protein
MLKTIARPHRSHLRSDTTDTQKLFVMLKLIPSLEVAGARPPLALAFVVDTSASMRSFVDQEAAIRAAWRSGGAQNVNVDGGSYQSLDVDMPTLLDQAIEAAHAMIDDARLLPTDEVCVIHFDDDARVLLPLTPLSQKNHAHAAIEELRNFAGETRMALGLKCAMQEMERVSHETAKRVFVLTDGATADERECHALLPQIGALNAPLIGIGFGEEYNEQLLAQMADATSGRPYHLRQMSDLVKEVLEREVGQTAREVVTDLQLDIAVVKGVQLDKIHRAHPSLGEVSLQQRPYRLGNIAAGDYTVFVLEFSVAGVARPPSRARLAQFRLVGSTPGAAGVPRELPPLEIVIEFTNDAAVTAQIDPEVIGYVQQKNVGQLVEDAVAAAPRDPEKARQTLEVASGMTKKLGNDALSQMLEAAAGELNATGAISPQTRKTVALGTRTKTVKTAAVGDEGSDLSAEEIRRLSGT